ncbi:hypothetical protein [Gemmatimonas sp.]|uniref:hypothetical protein n=1 Tax=Gemmatimonas sp. TaxID=1962908 RepID=UPI003DA2AD8F
MSLFSPDKAKPLGTFTEARKRARARQMARREARAAERLKVAKIAAAMRKQQQSWRAIELHVESLVEASVLRRPYSHETIRQLAAAYASGKTSIEDYTDRRRAGRPNRIDHVLLNMIRQAVLTNEAHPVTQLHDALVQKAEALEIVPPSYDTVKRRVAEYGRAKRTAAAFGARAAQMEGMTHSTVPAKFPHDVWVLDEFDAPFYSRVFDKKLEKHVSVRATVITIADHRSGVIVGYWLVDPSRRIDPKTGLAMRAGFEAADVLAALLSAAWGRSLATPACAVFTGWLPRCLRWDNHSTHGSLREILTELGQRLGVEVASFHKASEDAPATSFADWQEVEVEGVQYSDAQHGIVVPKLPKMRAINRGKIERTIGVVKRWCSQVDSHVDRVMPLDRLEESPKHLRDVKAGAGSREYRRMPIAVDRLPDIENSRAMLDAVVRRFNHEAVPKRIGMTRRALYRQTWSDAGLRPGVDLLAALPINVGFVTAEGIVYDRDGVSTTFAYEVEGRYALLLDTEVTFKVDPIRRGIWVLIENRWCWVPDKFTWASAPGRAEQVARQATANSRYHASESIGARGAQKDERHGPGATAEDEKAAEETLEKKRRAPSAEAPADAAADAPTPTTPPPSASKPEAPSTPVFRSRADRLRDDDGQTPLDAVG